MSDLTLRPQDLGIGHLFGEVRDAVIVANATTGRIVLWNRAATRIFGYSVPEALAMSVEDLVPEHLKARHRAGMSRYGQTGHGSYTDSSELLEFPAVRKGGEEISIEMSLSPIAPIHDAGEADGRFVLAIVREVTERKRTLDRLAESERRFATVLANARAYVYRCRNEEGYPNEFASNYALELTGYPPEELLVGGAVRFGELIVEQDRRRVWEEVQAALARRERFELRYDIRRRDGELRHVEEFGQGIYDEEGIVVAIEGIVYDVTERERVVERLKEAEARYRTLVERIPAIVYIEEMNGRMSTLYDSPQIEDMLGYPQERHLEDPDYWIKIIHPDDREGVLADERRAIARGESLSQEYRVVAADGRTVWVRDDAVIVRDEGGEPLYWQGFIFDITERKTLEEQLEYQALHDALTGLPNRALFMDRLEHAVVRARRRDAKVAVLFMDLDNFKVINDSLGHEAGDQLLVAVAERLRACLRPEDTAARLGGDEFTILLEDLTGLGGAIRAAERIAEALRTAFVLGRREVFVTASFGIALWGEARQSPADLLRNADQAMYRAKNAGKARYEVFEEAMNARALERVEMENDLRRALERREFAVHYQPVVMLDASELMGFEALVRWDRPDHGLLVAGEFVPLAEDTGLIVPIGRWVLQEACRQAREWQQRYPNDPPPTVFVNLSAKQLQDPDLSQTVARITRQTGLDPRSLELEITEGTAMGDAPTTATVLEELETLGVRVAIDDFGTGYSSLSYLERFPVDSLKIDRSFVEKLGQDPGTTVLVRGMIDLAHALGLRVIAEGVETTEQLRLVRELGCDLAQGNHFSKPLPHEAAGALLKTRTL